MFVPSQNCLGIFQSWISSDLFRIAYTAAQYTVAYAGAYAVAYTVAYSVAYIVPYSVAYAVANAVTYAVSYTIAYVVLYAVAQGPSIYYVIKILTLLYPTHLVLLVHLAVQGCDFESGLYA